MKRLTDTSKLFKILFTLILLLCLAACDNTSTDSDSDIDDEKPQHEVTLDDVKDHSSAIQNLIKDSKTTQTIPISSSHKIQKDLENDKIPKEESVALELIAGFYPDQLPSRYQGDDTEGTSGLQDALFWLHYNWDSLDKKTQDELEPFYVSIRDPKSHINKDEKSKIAETLSIIPSVSAASHSVDDIKIDGKTVAGVMYESQHAGQSIDVEKAIRKAWPMYKSLFGLVPDEPIRFLIANPLTPNGAADMVPTDSGTKMCDVFIKGGMSDKLTQSTTVHELFHCFQFHIPLEYNKTDTKWLMEATAVWSEHYVYKDYNKEFKWLPGLFYSLSSDTIRYGLDMEYQTYVFFLYLTQKTGSDQIVKDLLFSAKTKGGRKAIANLPKLNEYFAEYVLWNWNQDSWYLYHDTPSFPEGEYKGSPMKPVGKSLSTKYYQDDKKNPETAEIEPLSARYHLQVFSDTIDKVTYTFETPGNDAHKIQALVSIDGNWHYEDWTGLSEKTFCKSSSTEDVEAIVLILSNADAYTSHKYKYEINTKDKCPKKWRGTLRIKWDAENSESYNGVNGKGSTTEYKYSGEYISNEILEEDDGDFEIIKQTITYNSQRYTDIRGTGGCGWKYQFTGTDHSGSVSVDNTGKKYKHSRWSYELDDDDKKTNNLYFEGQHFTVGKDWGQSTHTIKSEWVPCDSSIEPTIQNQVLTSELSDLPSFGESFDLIQDPNSKVLKGEFIDETGSDGVGDYDVIISYDYRLE